MAIKWVMGILQKRDHILIARLKNKNPLISRLQWTFPFKKLGDDESPRKAAGDVFKNINIECTTKKFLLKHIPSENSKIEQYYYELEYNSGLPRANALYSEFVWIKPTQVLKYFTTSINKDLMDYLRNMESTGKGFIVE